MIQFDYFFQMGWDHQLVYNWNMCFITLPKFNMEPEHDTLE